MRYLVSLALILMVGCNQSNSDSDGGIKASDTCPTALPQAYYTVNITSTSEVIPNKILIEENGVVIFDECSEPLTGPMPPIASVERVSSNDLKFKVNYYNSKNEPALINLKILNQLSCTGGNSSFFEANDKSLLYEKVHPYGENCVANEKAELSLTK